MTAKRVFVSHASEDKERFVIPFATALLQKGIDAWVDQWEILPGDSLVDKLFEEGLKNADAVLIVISPYSILKPWVRLELDTAVVNRITRQSKIIPVVLDGAEVPESLRSLVWETVRDVSNFSVTLERVVSAIYEHREKPALGNPPSYVRERSIPGLQKLDMAVLKAIYEDAVAHNHPIWDATEIFAKFDDVQTELLLDSLEILEQQGYLKISKYMGVPRGIGVLQPTLNGFMVFARTFLPEFEDFHLKIGLAILNQDQSSARGLAETTAVPRFAVDQILDLFDSKGWIRLSKCIGDAHIFQVLPSMRRAFA
jgi:hypothetical protein